MTASAWLFTALFLSACTPAVVAPDPPGNATVFVIERSWHSDIGVPVDEVTGPLTSLTQRFPGVRVLTFGFGERQFLLSRQVTFGGMLRAMLPSRSALLMTALGTDPAAAFGEGNVVAVHVTQEGLAGIEAAIWEELEKTPDGGPEMLGDGPYPGSAVLCVARHV